MGIGTSLGAYFDDDFHHAAAKWDNKYDDNEDTPEAEDVPELSTGEERI